MKVAVTFLGKKHKVFNNKNIDSVKEAISKSVFNLKLLTIIAFSCIAVIGISKCVKIDSKILEFSTNFRQAKTKELKVIDIFLKYNIYNKDNYIFRSDSEDTKKSEEKKDNQKGVYDNTNQVNILDKEVEEVVDSAVFFANKPVAQITESSKDIQRITIDNTKVLNYSTKRDVDYANLISQDIVLTKKSDKILIYNTHTSESYANSDAYVFEYTGTKRTTDAKYNTLATAKEFDKNLKEKGFESYQNTTPHDYGTYTSAYAKSRITVKDALASMGGAGISIDLHRDASSDLEFRPSINIKGVDVAQCMFVLGAGSTNSPNPYYQDNLKLALKLQKIADDLYPGLFRPMIIRNSVYNQDLNKYSMLIEVGATGNTVEEVKLATRCVANLLNILYKD